MDDKLKPIVVKCPLRISVLGGGTDIPEIMDKLPEKRGGVLAFPIDKFVYAVVTPGKTDVGGVQIDPRVDTLITRAVLGTGTSPVSSIGMVSDVPVIGTGLGGSAAWIQALSEALHLANEANYHYPSYTRMKAGRAYDLERSTGSACGMQDHSMAYYRIGGLYTFKKRDHRIDIDRFTSSHLFDKIHYHCKLFYIGGRRDGNEILSRIEKPEKKFEYDLGDMLMLLEKGFTALTLQDYERFGKAVRESWKIKKSMDYAVSNDRIDSLIDAAIAAGAFGAKLLGAGGAGYILTVGGYRMHEALAKVDPSIREIAYTYYEDEK